jgi:hypothetical protein
VAKGLNKSISFVSNFMWGARGRVFGKMEGKVKTVAEKRGVGISVLPAVRGIGPSHNQMKVAEYKEESAQQVEEENNWRENNIITVECQDLVRELRLEVKEEEKKPPSEGETEKIEEKTEKEVVEKDVTPAPVLTNEMIAGFGGDADEIKKGLDNISLNIANVNADTKPEEVNKIYEELNGVRRKISELSRKCRGVEVPVDLSNELKYTFEKVTSELG